MTEYRLIRSRRKTLSLRVGNDLVPEVRAPLKMPKSVIESFLADKADWLAKATERVRRFNERNETMRENEAELRSRAERELPELVSRYGDIMGLHPVSIAVGGAQKRLGSCSSDGRIRFSYRLMGYDPRVIEYVVVHELAHLRHMDHGKAFYALIASVLPDYRDRIRLMK